VSRYFKLCPICRGHGVIDHVNLTHPGPSIWTTDCRDCKSVRAVEVKASELPRTPGPATKLVLDKLQEEMDWQCRTNPQPTEDEDEGSIWFTVGEMRAFIAEWKEGTAP